MLEDYITNENNLNDSNNENTPWLSPIGIKCKCKVVDVYDGDTVTIVLPFTKDLYKVKCRLLGIDSAEKRTTNLKEKKVALEATEWLTNLIYDKVIWVDCGTWGKYGGRMLGSLYMTKEDMDNDISVNNKIIEMGYAYKYDGKKRKNFEDWYINK
jgi:endonuclease YncB( thermonuclease family)